MVELSLYLVSGLITPVGIWGPLWELRGSWMTVSLFSRITCSQTIFLRGHLGMSPSSRLRTVGLTLLLFLPSM